MTYTTNGESTLPLEMRLSTSLAATCTHLAPPRYLPIKTKVTLRSSGTHSTCSSWCVAEGERGLVRLRMGPTCARGLTCSLLLRLGVVTMTGIVSCHRRTCHVTCRRRRTGSLRVRPLLESTISAPHACAAPLPSSPKRGLQEAYRSSNTENLVFKAFSQGKSRDPPKATFLECLGESLL